MASSSIAPPEISASEDIRSLFGRIVAAARRDIGLTVEQFAASLSLKAKPGSIPFSELRARFGTDALQILNEATKTRLCADVFSPHDIENIESGVEDIAAWKPDHASRFLRSLQALWDAGDSAPNPYFSAILSIIREKSFVYGEENETVQKDERGDVLFKAERRVAIQERLACLRQLFKQHNITWDPRLPKPNDAVVFLLGYPCREIQGSAHYQNNLTTFSHTVRRLFRSSADNIKKEIENILRAIAEVQQEYLGTTELQSPLKAQPKEKKDTHLLMIAAKQFHLILLTPMNELDVPKGKDRPKKIAQMALYSTLGADDKAKTKKMRMSKIHQAIQDDMKARNVSYAVYVCEDDQRKITAFRNKDDQISYGRDINTRHAFGALLKMDGRIMIEEVPTSHVHAIQARRSSQGTRQRS